MTDHDELTNGRPRVSDDPAAVLRTTLEQLMTPVEQQLRQWDTELPQALAGPAWTPLLRQRLAQLQETALKCRALGEAMAAAATRPPVRWPTGPDLGGGSDGDAFRAAGEDDST